MAEAVIDRFESALDGIGLMRGPMAIPKRLVFGAILGGLVVTYIKPNFMFVDGQPREWSVTSEDDDATLFPWWSLPIVGALLFGVFI